MHVLRRSTYLIIDQLGAKVWAQSAFPSPKTVQLIMNDLAKFIILHHTLYYMTGFIDDISRFKSTFFMELTQSKYSEVGNSAMSINLYSDNFPDTRI